MHYLESYTHARHVVVAIIFALIVVAAIGAFYPTPPNNSASVSPYSYPQLLSQQYQQAAQPTSVIQQTTATSELPQGTVGEEYVADIPPVGPGSGNLSNWSISSGSLPSGLSL